MVGRCLARVRKRSGHTARSFERAISVGLCRDNPPHLFGGAWPLFRATDQPILARLFALKAQRRGKKIDWRQDVDTDV